MEKFSQFRDRGSGVSPFIPVTTPSSPPATVFHALLFFLRLPFFIAYAAAYFFVLQHLPLPAVARKVLLWLLLLIPGVWWVDLQLDGVKRGSLSQQPRSRVPGPGSVIAANCTSPLDALYLAAVFDPVFVRCHPTSRRVVRVGLLGAVLAALSPHAQFSSGTLTWENRWRSDELVDLRNVVAAAASEDRAVVIFPEGGTTNGRGILPLTYALLRASAQTPIFPLSMRYTPPDVTTPVPGHWGWLLFIWKLLGRPTHCIRVRIAEALYNSTIATNGVGAAQDEERRITDLRDFTAPSPEEQRLLDRVADALARLGRARRVGLTLRDKANFVGAWNKSR